MNLAPLTRTYDWKEQIDFKPSKWKWTAFQKHAGLSHWKKESEIGTGDLCYTSNNITTNVPKLEFSDNDLDTLNLNSTWTLQETKEFIEKLCFFNLNFIIIQDALSFTKSIEELLQKYSQLSQKKLNRFNFDKEHDTTRRQNLAHLITQPDRLKEEELLMNELLEFESKHKKIQNRREYLYKIHSHNQEAAARVEKQTKKTKKPALTVLKKKDQAVGVYLSSSRVIPIKVHLQQKFNLVLGEYLPEPVKMPSLNVMDTLEQLYSSIYSLLDVRKQTEKIQAEIKAWKEYKLSMEDDIKHGRPISMVLTL
jgi:hypothetical protein